MSEARTYLATARMVTFVVPPTTVVGRAHVGPAASAEGTMVNTI